MVEHGCDITGVDIVQHYVEQARENVPDASCLQSDLLELDVEEDSFDAVTSFYAVFHVPRGRHEQLFRKISRWLRPGGMLLVTVGAGDRFEGTEEFAGAEMAWSYYSEDRSLSLIREAGFEIKDTHEEQRGDEHHLWVLAEKR